MTRTWCKVSASLDSHPKIRRAGNLGRQVFEFALRRNAEIDRNGSIPADHLDPVYLSDQLMMQTADAVSGLSACVRTGLLAQDGTCYVITGWDDEWGRRPMTEAERKRNQRANTRKDLSGLPDVTKCPDTSRSESDCPECHGSDQRRSEEIRGEEIKSAPAASGPQAAQDSSASRPPKQPRTRKASAVSMPAGWEPRPQEIAKATAKGLSADALREQFVDHHTAKGSVFVDWDAAFRTWIGNATRFATGTQNGRMGPRPRTLFEAAMDAAAAADAREAGEVES